jgi:universal stress protein A
MACVTVWIDLISEDQISSPESMSIKHILVPVDFSEGTPSSIACALELAGKFSALITLYHVVQLMHPVGLEPVFTYEKEVKSVEDAAEKQLRKLAGSIAPMAEVETAMEAGVPWDKIVKYADKHGVNLIVMATHGRSGLTRLMLGSVAERVVQHAPCCVLVVREKPANSVSNS